MPTGPKGQKRPADVIGNAVRVPRGKVAQRPAAHHPLDLGEQHVEQQNGDDSDER